MDLSATWVKVVAVALALALLLGAAWKVEDVWSSSITAAREDGRRAGRETALREVSERDNEKMRAAEKVILDLQASARDKENQAAKELIDAITAHDAEKEALNAKNAQLNADIRAHRVRLRDVQGIADRCRSSGGGERPAGEAPTATGGSDGGSGCELSGRASAGLAALAQRADRVRGNLKLCQATVMSYLKACN